MKKNKKENSFQIKPLGSQNFKEVKALSKLAAWVTIIFAVAFALAIILLGVDTAVNYDKYTLESIKSEEVPVVSYIKTINHYDTTDAVDVLSRMKKNPDATAIDFTFEIVVPTILYLANLGAIIYSAVIVLKIFKDSTTEGKLYTNENVQRMFNLAEALTATILYYILFFNAIVVLPLILSVSILGTLALAFKKTVKDQEEIKKLKKQLKAAN